MLIRLFPHFTDGGTPLEETNERENKNELMVQPEPKLLSSAQKFVDFKTIFKNPQLFTFHSLSWFPDKTHSMSCKMLIFR